MNTFFPVYLLSILSEFRQYFSKPNFEYFKAYVWAMMINTGSKCMTNTAQACFFLGKHISSFERFLSENKWDLYAIRRQLVEILLRKLYPLLMIHDALLGIYDTTLVAKASKQMVAIQKWHNSTQNADQSRAIIGHQWGIIGLACAARHKERFSGLVPMNTTGFLPRSRSGFRALAGARAVPYLWLYKTPWLGKKMAVDWNLFLRFAMTLGIHNRGRQLTEKALAGYLYPFQRPRDRAAILASVRQVPMAPFTAVWRMLWRTEKALSGWDVPARCIWGTRDPVFVPWFVQRFEELLPNHMESLLIPTASHFLQDDEPGIVTRGIREFMAWAENQRKVKAA